MNDFELEERYLVIKKKDLSEVMKNLTVRQRYAFCEVVAAVNEHRTQRGKDEIAVVVVESDWSIYDEVCKLVEQEATSDE